MQKTDIMVLCAHPGILATLVRLVNNNIQWQATGFGAVADAITASGDKPYKLALLGSGFSARDELLLTGALQHLPVIKHYGGGSGLLNAEVYAGLAQAEATF